MKQVLFNTENLRKDCAKKNDQKKEAKAKLKEIEKNLAQKNCQGCFKYVISSKYIVIPDILSVLHVEIIQFVKNLESQIEM
jgi:hypothetical protein